MRGESLFLVKGADTMMSSIVQHNDWLLDNMTREEGLRTPVVSRKVLSQGQYSDFEQRYSAAKLSDVNMTAQVAALVEGLQRDMQLLCVTGVEDKLQKGVRQSLEMLRNGGMRVWRQTVDKRETVTFITKSSKLVSLTQAIHTFRTVATRAEAHQELNLFRLKQDTALISRGVSLVVYVHYYEHDLMESLPLSAAGALLSRRPWW